MTGLPSSAERSSRPGGMSSPWDRFAEWLLAAVAMDADPGSVCLATVNPAGEPTLRTVQLQECSEHGFVFFADSRSRKARHLADNAAVGLHWFWPAARRQLAVNGHARRLSRFESWRRLAAQSVRELPASGTDLLRAAQQAFAANWLAARDRHQAGWPPSLTWVGYRVVPHEFEFWNGTGPRPQRQFHRHQPDGSWHLSDDLRPA